MVVESNKEDNIIMQVLGTPNEDNWPGIGRTEELQSYKFPHYTAEPLVARAPRLDPDGISLLNSFLHFEARRRISAREAMRNPYFQSLGSGVAQLGDSECFHNQFFSYDFLIKPRLCSFVSPTLLNCRWVGSLQSSWELSFCSLFLFFQL